MIKDFNPYDAELHKDPYPAYRALRQEQPVYHNARRGFWVISRHDDVMNVLLDSETFSSARGITLPMDTDGVVLSEVEGPPTASMITMDPPRHDQLRSMVNRAFTKRRIADLEPAIRDVARELVARFPASGECDVVREFAGPFPTTVISELLGADREHRVLFKRCADTIISSTDQLGFMDTQDAQSVIAILMDAIEDRRRKPKDDMISLLVDVSAEEGALSEEELISFIFVLLLAGTETTTNLISNSLVMMHRNPEFRRALVADPSLLPAAIEEFLRFDSPVQGIARFTTRAAEIRGVTIPKDEWVWVIPGSANRDETNFDRPDVLDIRRPPKQNLAFGFGVHFCIGANLARLEARVAFEELLPRIPDFEALEEAAERIHSGPIRGFTKLPLRWG